MPRTWTSLIASAAVLAVVGLAQTPVGRAALRGAGLDQAPTAYTALSFTRPQSLPAQLPDQHLTLRVAFTIRNVSGGTRGYRWSLTAAQAGRPVGRGATGTTSLAPGATAILSPALPLTCTRGQLRVTVRLASPAETIDFLTRCPGRAP